MSIKSQIEAILDKRLGRNAYAGRGRLQQIEKRIKDIEDVKMRIYELEALINTISNQIEAQQGEYYTMFVKDPDALAKFNDLKGLYITTNGRKQLKALSKIDALIGKLELLKLRFNRKAIRIAFIGAERQGKSTFIKTITGLTDKVIPAYSGNSCTGAVSVIHNVDKVVDEKNNERDVKVVVGYYNANEFIEMVNEKLLRFFPDGSKFVGNMPQIASLTFPEQLNLEANLAIEFDKFKKSVIDNYSEYCELIGTGVQTYYDEDIIAQHVAQYEEFDRQVANSVPVVKEDGRTVYEIKYYKYVAVKNVNIYRRFDVETTRLLELVDSIGIGGAADSNAVEKEMYRILREDCDAAIDLFRPEATSAIPQIQTDILTNIGNELMDRDPSKWIVYVLNKIKQGVFKNEHSIGNALETVQNSLKKTTPTPVAWTKAVRGDDFNDVRDSLVLPLLQLIAENLESLDEKLVMQADGIADEAYNECLSLVKAANDVTSASAGMDTDVLTLFEEKLYKEMLESFGREMNQIDMKGYAKRKDEECPELLEAYQGVINKLTTYLPDEDMILERFASGAMVTPIQLFGEYVEQLRNDIFNAFECVNTEVLYPLQEKVKNELIAILFNKGLMSSLPTPYDSPSQEWLKNVMENYIDETVYPNLYKALKFILDYQINVEGLVEYNVTRSLYIIDRTHREFIPYCGEFQDDFEGQASEVWGELYNRITPIQKRLREWVASFTLIPSHSFYSRVHKFYIKVLTDKAGVEEFHRFYRKNMGLIWATDINSVGKKQKAFGDWTGRVKRLSEVVKRETFK